MSTASEPVERLIIERIAPGGDGLARLGSGEIVFVPGTAPGDEIELGAVVRNKGIAHGTVQRLVTPGPSRVCPPCAHARECGGCDFMHLSLEGQREAKLALLQDALRRVGNNAHAHTTIGFVSSEVTLGYRSRARLHTSKDGQVGFLAAKSSQVVALDECKVASSRINSALSMFADLDAAARKRLSFCEQIELRESNKEPFLIARLIPRPKARLTADRYGSLFPTGTQVLIAGQADEDRTQQRFSLPNGVEITAPATAFTQVNQLVNQKLVAAALDAAARYSVRTFVDAYAGAGNFTLPLLACGLKGEALDEHAPGIYAARSTARDRGLPFDGFQVGDARRLLDAMVRSKRRFDMVLLDPPREGSKDVLSAALGLKPRLVLLVACDPVALARDLKTVVSAGGDVEALTIFDMFPHTHHFETLAVVAMNSE